MLLACKIKRKIYERGAMKSNPGGKCHSTVQIDWFVWKIISYEYSVGYLRAQMGLIFSPVFLWPRIILVNYILTSFIKD